MRHMQFGTFTRISKRTARKLYNEKKEFYATGSNLRPGSPWFPEVILGSDHNYSNGYSFDAVVNAFTYYNGPPVMFWTSSDHVSAPKFRSFPIS